MSTHAATLVSVAEAQRTLGGICRSHVYELIAHGELEAVKLGRRRMVVAASIDAYIERLRGADAP